MRQEVDFQVRGVGSKFGGEGATGDGLPKSQLGHHKAGLGQQLRVAEPDDAAPDEGGIAVHAEAGHEAAGKAGSFVNPGQRVDVDEEGDGGGILALWLLSRADVLLDVGLRIGVARL